MPLGTVYIPLSALKPHVNDVNLTTSLSGVPDVHGQTGEVEPERCEVAVRVERADALQPVHRGLGAIV